MTREEVEQKVKTAVANVLGLDVREVLLMDRLKEDLEAHDFDILDVVSDLEAEFQAMAMDRDLDKFRTVDSLVQFFSDSVTSEVP